MAHLELSGSPVPKTTVATRYSFLDSRKTSGFVLDQSWLTYQTTEYDTFQPFLSSFLTGLRTVNEEAVLSYSERVGTRFLDAAIPMNGETVSDYLQPNMLGLSNSLPDRQLVHQISETRTTRGKTMLVSRAIIFSQKEGAVAFPEDLQPVALRPMNKFSEVKGQYAIIDTDGWVEDRQDFDLSNLEMVLDSLHTDIGSSFQKMVTPHALKVWE
jgi:uncharacterized protein (TIGR04255 family)